LSKNYADAERLLDVVSLHAYLNYIAIACTYTKHYEDAERYLKKALVIAGPRKSTLRLGIYQNLRNLHKLKGEYKTALYYADTTTELREDIYNLQRTKELNSIQTRYQTAQKELENTTLRQQNELTEAKNTEFKVFLIVLGGVALLILFLLLKLRNSNHRLNEALSKEQVLNHMKDKIFSLLSHDLRRPLAELTDLLTIWHKPQINAAKKEHLLSQIGLELLNVQFVLNNLLRWSFAQLQKLPPNRKDTSLQNLCKDAIAEVKTYAAHKNIRITWITQV
jgi:signal transduction histidine kinase